MSLPSPSETPALAAAHGDVTLCLDDGVPPGLLAGAHATSHLASRIKACGHCCSRPVAACVGLWKGRLGPGAAEGP